MAEINQGRNWVDRQLQRRASAVMVVGMPFAILAFDWVVRFAAQCDASDAPADLCMLALVAFGTIVAGDIKQYRELRGQEVKKAIERRLVVDAFSLLMFGVLWFISLVLVSSNHWIWQAWSVPSSVRVGLAMVMGLATVGYVASLVAGGSA